jgi:hypothetical protein
MSIVTDMLPIPPQKVKEAAVAISMNIFSKMMFGMGLANAILMAMADTKITPGEVIGILQFALQGLGVESKLTLDDIKIVHAEDGSVSLTFSKKLIDKLHLSV